MSTPVKLPAPFGGPIEIGLVDPITKKWTTIQRKDKNLILYGAADILGKIMSGKSEYIPSYMYFEFTNGSESPVDNSNKAITTSYYTGLVAPKDYMRVPIDSTPALSESDANYSNNVVTYLATVGNGTGVNGSEFSNSQPSLVVGGALVSSPDGTLASDIVFSRFYFSTAITVTAEMLIGIKWSMQFNS
jgi:hypothetical protein